MKKKVDATVMIQVVSTMVMEGGDRDGEEVPTAKEGTCLRGRDTHSSFLFLLNKSLFFNLKSQSLNFFLPCV